MVEIIIFIALIYFFIVFILARFIVPYLGFKDDELPKDIPEDIINAVEKIKSKAESKRKFLELAYKYLGDKYYTGRLMTILKFPYLFKDLNTVWGMRGFMPCTRSNFLMRIFLIKSGFFQEDEIRRRHIFCNFLIHQYLRVKINNEWINVDVGEKQRGAPIGKYLKYFG